MTLLTGRLFTEIVETLNPYWIQCRIDWRIRETKISVAGRCIAVCALALAAEGNEMLTACLEDAQAACASCTSGSDSCEKLYEDMKKKC